MFYFILYLQIYHNRFEFNRSKLDQEYVLLFNTNENWENTRSEIDGVIY